MASTYSPSLRIELIGAGDQAGTWNTTTNSNLGTIIESAIAGYVAVSVTSANQAFTALDGAADQARNAVIALTTTTTAAFAVTSVGTATSLGSFTSAQLLGALTDETGTGSAVFATSPTLVTPALGTPTALVGTNITGTAAALNIGGNAATATLATTATNAVQITNAGGWSITPSGTTLFFSYNGVNVAKIDSSGNMTLKANDTAFGTV